MPISLAHYPAVKTPSSASIILFPGWGFTRECWQPLLHSLKEVSDVYALDIDYSGENLNQLCDAIAAILPEKMIALGWSLGGMLATRLASDYGDRVQGLITLASNGVFVANTQWVSAMEASAFMKFSSQVRKNPDLGLKKFLSLQTLGDDQAEQKKQWLQQLPQDSNTDSLAQGLQILAKFNNVQRLSTIHCPGLHFLGANDALVPNDASTLLRQQFGEQHKLITIAGAGHVLHFPQATIIDHLSEFFSHLQHEVISD
ncbi:MAG: alpha/beta fold hydrolase [Pseudomonadota bacterium]